MSESAMLSHLEQMESNRELAVSLAVKIGADLVAAIEQRGVATLAVSGGSTPRPLFHQLSRMPLDWSKVLVTLVDERWVDEDHEDSNARLVRAHLIRNEAGTARFVSMKTATASAFEAEAEVAARLVDFAEGIDVVVLGMGEDGHTASFFSGAETLSRALEPSSTEFCVAVRPPHAPHDRMTLSLPALLRARNTYLHITGATKLEVLRRAAQPGPIEELPIRAVLLGAERPLEIYYAPRS